MLALGHHYYLNIVPLAGWAKMNVLLIINTYYTTMLSMYSILIVMGDPIVMMSSYTERLIFFLFALGSQTVFLSNAMALLVSFFKRGRDTSHELMNIVQVYSLLLTVGSAFPAFIIFLYECANISPYSMFNKDYGNWDNISIPGQDESVKDSLDNKFGPGHEEKAKKGLREKL